MNPEVAVVIPLFNGERYIGALMESLCMQTNAPAFEIVVADNGSLDNGAAVVESFYAKANVRVVDARRGRGQTVARNVGAAHASANLLLFVDQDDTVSPNYVAAMADALQHAPLVAARIDKLLLNVGWRSGIRTMAQQSGLAPGPPYEWGYGGTLGIQRGTFDAIGGFDESLRWAAEDEDLCWRAQAAGATIAFVPDAILHYRFLDNPTALFRQARRYGLAQVEVDRKHFRDPRGATLLLGLCKNVVINTVRSVTGRTRMKRARSAFLLGRNVGLLEGAFRAPQTPVPVQLVEPTGELEFGPQGGGGATSCDTEATPKTAMHRQATVVVPVHNGALTLPEQLQALSSQNFDGGLDFVIVDNASTDDTAAIVLDAARRDERFRLVVEPKPGANHARNAGLRAARFEAVLLCDADDVVDTGWVTALFEALQTSDCVGGSLSYPRLNTASTLRRWGVEGEFAHYKDVPFGGNCGVRRSVWERVGCFDVDRSVAGEDTEFFIRAEKLGFRVTRAPDAVVHVRVRDSLRGVWLRQYRVGKARTLQPIGEIRQIGAHSVLRHCRAFVSLAVRFPLLPFAQRIRARVWRQSALATGAAAADVIRLRLVVSRSFDRARIG